MSENNNSNQNNNQKKPKVIAIVGASEFNHAHFLNGLKNGMFAGIIAADGGFKALNELGVIPNMVIGDFDSLGYIPQDNIKCTIQYKDQPEQTMRVMQYPEDKDKTDLELAIDEAIDMKPQLLMVYGALGGRFDQTMSTIQMLAHISDHRIGVFCIGLKESCVVINGPSQFGLGIPDDDSIDKTLSVFSISDVSLIEKSSGLKWPYINTALTSSMSLGISNVITDKQVKIAVKQGKVLMIFSTDLLMPINSKK